MKRFLSLFVCAAFAYHLTIPHSLAIEVVASAEINGQVITSPPAPTVAITQSNRTFTRVNFERSTSTHFKYVENFFDSSQLFDNYRNASTKRKGMRILEHLYYSL